MRVAYETDMLDPLEKHADFYRIGVNVIGEDILIDRPAGEAWIKSIVAAMSPSLALKDLRIAACLRIPIVCP